MSESIAIEKLNLKEESCTAASVRLQVIISSNKFDAINEYCDNLFSTAAEYSLSPRGLARLPTRNMSITTRKSPCGQGTNTWEKWTCRVYKRIFTVDVPGEKEAFLLSIAPAEHVNIKTNIMAE